MRVRVINARENPIKLLGYPDVTVSAVPIARVLQGYWIYKQETA